MTLRYANGLLTWGTESKTRNDNNRGARDDNKNIMRNLLFQTVVQKRKRLLPQKNRNRSLKKHESLRNVFWERLPKLSYPK